MKSPNRERNFLLALVELLFALLIIFSIVINIDEDKKDNSALKLLGRYLIVARWAQDKSLTQNDDIDLHLLTVNGEYHAWFASPDGGQSYITMDSIDDTGGIVYYTDIDTGAIKACLAHEERVTINTPIPGAEFVAIVYMYNKRLTGVPIKVIVTLIDLKNNSTELVKKEVVLTTVSEQKVAFRFSVDQLGI